MLPVQAKTDAALPMSMSQEHELFGMQVHAACNGVWGYRASTGTGPADSSASIAGALDAVGWTCRHSQDLQLIGEALNLPGSKSGTQPPFDPNIWRACLTIMRTAPTPSLVPHTQTTD